MNQNTEYNNRAERDPIIPDTFQFVAGSGKSENEFGVPAGYFDELKSRVLSQSYLLAFKQIPHFDDLKIAGNEMEDLTNRILSQSEAELNPETEQFFEEQKKRIMSHVGIDDVEQREIQFSTSETFFENQHEEIFSKIRTTATAGQGRTIYLRRNKILYIAAAACIAIFIVFILPKKEQGPAAPTFEQLVAGNPVDIDDLPYITEESDYYESYLIEAGLTEEEHNTIDSLLMATRAENFNADEQAITPINTKSNTDTKPSADEDTPNWQELSENEILEYLYHEESADWIEELN